MRGGRRDPTFGPLGTSPVEREGALRADQYGTRPKSEISPKSEIRVRFTGCL